MVYSHCRQLTVDSVTGCIRPETVDRLNSDDMGGQYDSSGGADGVGNPRDSVCSGYVCLVHSS